MDTQYFLQRRQEMEFSFQLRCFLDPKIQNSKEMDFYEIVTWAYESALFFMLNPIAASRPTPNQAKIKKIPKQLLLTEFV